mmetsp:Transcript_90780/g.211214  ORF Transcript_90780/g.211214 Transcript_90780/m.211214 type:complete len:253 (+) Transcript_90780:63-821(+)
MWSSALCAAVAGLTAGWLQGCGEYSEEGPPRDPERLVEVFKQKISDTEFWRQQLSPLANDTLTECYRGDTLHKRDGGEWRLYRFHLKNITNAKQLRFTKIASPSVELGADGAISFSVEIHFYTQGILFKGIGELIDDSPDKAPADKHNYSGPVERMSKPRDMLATWSGSLKETFATKKVCTTRNHLLIDAPQTKATQVALVSSSGRLDPLVDKNYGSQSALESVGTVYSYLSGCGWDFPWVRNDSAWCIDWH